MPSEKRARQRANREQARNQAVTEKKVSQRKRNARFFGITIGTIVVLVLVFAFVQSRGSDDDDTSATTVAGGATSTTVAGEAPCTPPTDRPTYSEQPTVELDPDTQYQAVLTVAGGDVTGEIVIDLDPVAAPRTVENFVALSQDGYFDCTLFHRIIPGYVMQGGSPNGTSTGGPGYTIPDELPAADATDPYPVGSVVMANTGAPDSGGSQFFIVLGDASGLDPTYSKFATVSQGMDVADALQAYGSNTQEGTTTVPVYLVSSEIVETPAGATTTTAAAATTTTAAG